MWGNSGVFPEYRGTQGLCAQRCRSPLCPRRSCCGVADSWRWTRERPSCGNGKCPPYCWAGVRCRNCSQVASGRGRKVAVSPDRPHATLEAGLDEEIILNGHPEKRLPNTLNVNFFDHIGSELLAKVPEIAASTGSACREGQVTQSAVLRAMKVPSGVGKGAVRLSVGRITTEDEIDRAAGILLKATSTMARA
jgi:hypothetical protein